MSLELEDHNWFPPLLRRYQMEYISWLVMKLATYQPLVPLLKEMQQRHHLNEWTDCCSGAAGPVKYLVKNGFVTEAIFITDHYLNPINSDEFESASVEQHKVEIPKDDIPGRGLVTMFNAFHHLPEADQDAFMQKIITQRRPLLVCEILSPDVLSMLSVIVATTILQLLSAPFVKPFDAKRILLTYLPPVNIFTTTWDGCVSVFRAIPEKRYRSICKTFSTADYQVRYLQKGPWWNKVHILMGEPIA